MNRNMIRVKATFGLLADSCQSCPMMRYNHASDMRFCWQSGELLPNWKERRGELCLLKMDKTEDKSE